jgi:hypothetical protein
MRGDRATSCLTGQIVSVALKRAPHHATRTPAKAGVQLRAARREPERSPPGPRPSPGYACSHTVVRLQAAAGSPQVRLVRKGHLAPSSASETLEPADRPTAPATPDRASEKAEPRAPTSCQPLFCAAPGSPPARDARCAAGSAHAGPKRPQLLRTSRTRIGAHAPSHANTPAKAGAQLGNPATPAHRLGSRAKAPPDTRARVRRAIQSVERYRVGGPAPVSVSVRPLKRAIARYGFSDAGTMPVLAMLGKPRRSVVNAISDQRAPVNPADSAQHATPGHGPTPRRGTP